jgi:N-acetylglucosaminyl-diphospho-decaprenol L-rhamnosyltransferase
LSESKARIEVPDVSVIMVTWNSARWVGACIEALAAACEDVEWEVVVVDNASADDSAAIAERHAGERGRVIRNQANRGFAGGVNQAIEAAHGEFLLLVNPDCVLDPGSVARLVEACQAGADVAGAAPRLRGADGVPQDRFQFRRLPTAGALVAELLFVDKLAPWNPATARYRCRDCDFSRPGDVEQPAFSAVLLKTRVVRREGPLDESFRPAWFDDVDYCRRLRAAGYRFVVVPDATGVHAGGASLEAMHRGAFAVIWYGNMHRYARKWLTAGGAELLRWSIIAGMSIRIVATAFGLGRFDGAVARSSADGSRF